ncbi:hypothetical protein AB0M19_27210 [Streptomyces sp. NPDC051920]|uniref:hypothetical protein n=1 Tax=Streptomyces sp. NPDC051920 TaxID=3155523 RepID=UPI0034468AAA
MRSPQRTKAQNAAFAAAVIGVLATMTLGAFAGVSLATGLADNSGLSDLVPADGRNSLVIGGIGAGGLTGLLVPLIIAGLVKGTEDKPRLRPTEALADLLALLVFDVYLLVVSVIVAQFGRILPEGLTVLLSVFAIGFSWMPLALIPWERFGITVPGARLGSGSRPDSHELD